MITVIQNKPKYPDWFKSEWIGSDHDIWGAPTIIIKIGDPDWEIAYQNWLSGKNPTDSPEWKKGIFAH